jgi:hypothetical protein
MPATDLTVEIWYSAAWHDHTTSVRTTDPLTITRGVPDQAQLPPPSTMTLKINNRDGAFSPRNPASALYGLIGRNTPIRVSVGTSIRFVGEVEAWPVRWNLNGSDVWVSIVANGITRRLNAPGTKKLARSALRRFMAASTIVAAYWPMEDYAEQPQLVSSDKPGIADATINTNSNPAVVSPFNWPGDATLPGSGTLPVLENNQTAIAGIAANFSVAANPAIGMALWTHTPIPKTDNAHAINTQALQSVIINHGSVGFALAVTTFPPGSTLAAVPAAGEVQVRVNYTLDGVIQDFINITGRTYIDAWRHCVVLLVTSGADVTVVVRLDDEIIGADTLSSVNVGTVTRTSINAFAQDTTGFEVGRISIGHPAILTGTSTDIANWAGPAYVAGYGHNGEAAADRIERLCDEESIAFTLVGTADTELCGPQPTAPPLDVMFAAASVEAGLLFETRDELGLTFRTRKSLYSQDAAVTISYTAGDEVAPPLEPVDDTDAVVNDVTVIRMGGASARVTQDTGPLNTQEPTADPDGVGRYAQDVTLNLYADADALPQAQWRKHLGTWDETRFPSVTMNTTAMTIGGKTALVDDVDALDVGDRLVVTHTPAWLPHHDIDQQVRGYTETINSHVREIVTNTVPAGPYATVILDDPAWSKLGAGASTLTNDVDAADTSFSVTTAADAAIWTTAAAEFTTDGPLYIVIRDEQMQVTNITGAASPQTFTVTRTAGADHPAGSDVNVYRPARVAL